MPGWGKDGVHKVANAGLPETKNGVRMEDFVRGVLWAVEEGVQCPLKAWGVGCMSLQLLPAAPGAGGSGVCRTQPARGRGTAPVPLASCLQAKRSEPSSGEALPFETRAAVQSGGTRLPASAVGQVRWWHGRDAAGTGPGWVLPVPAGVAAWLAAGSARGRSGGLGASVWLALPAVLVWDQLAL